MKRKPSLLAYSCFVLALTSLLAAHANNQTPTAASSANQSAPIPMDQLGAVAGKQYQGDGLSVIATADGATLRCAFQRLEGQVTREGLWLSSTADNNSGERFRVMAMAVGRAETFGVRWQSEAATPLWEGDWWMNAAGNSESGVALRFPPQSKTLRVHGTVSVNDQSVRFIRPGLIEEYTVSVDGVRQDFVIFEKPGGASVPASRLASSLAPPAQGELRVELSVTGAKVERAADGARLVLDGSGRKLAYNRLRVTDATGRELPSRMEVPDKSEIRNQKSEISLAVLVDDAAAIYPVRIDPTFSDADWISMGGVPGIDGQVSAMVFDEFGNLYVGGGFSVAGGIKANHVAKWDGSSWSALGSGMNYGVSALAAIGTNIFAGGSFTIAGGVPVNRIAKWDGNAWSGLGTGIWGNDYHGVSALATSGTNLFVGGNFTNAGGVIANSIAKWDGVEWTALGSGISRSVAALAVADTNLYVGGSFLNAGGVEANRVAKWNGSNWSALGFGLNSDVTALAVSGTNLFAGGLFTSAGGVAAAGVARWNGNAWSALGAGINSPVNALAVSGQNLYVGAQVSGLEAR